MWKGFEFLDECEFLTNSNYTKCLHTLATIVKLSIFKINYRLRIPYQYKNSKIPISKQAFIDVIKLLMSNSNQTYFINASSRKISLK